MREKTVVTRDEKGSEEVENTGKKKKKKHPVLLGVGIFAFLLIIFCVIAAIVGMQRSGSRKAAGYGYSEEIRMITDNQFGCIEVSTLALPEGLRLQRGCFTVSGRVLYTVKDGAEIIFYTCDDYGQNQLELCRHTDIGGGRLLPFSDNRRVLLGDYVLECPEGSTMDSCEPGSAVLIPIIFPESFVSDANVTERWTEVIISPDCEHFAWTIRRKDCGAVNAMGKLVRTDNAYEVIDAVYISNMNNFTRNEDGTLNYSPVIGGEVKQFVHGGTAISLVGSDDSGMADSVVQDITTGKVTQLTHAPGYDETTILSPDEKLGLTMTSRFSESTDLAVMGLVDRPYGQVLHNILGQAYMYSVTGVRGGREGNVGPALIDLERSMNEPDYMGVDLSDPEEHWVFNSPLSWNDDGTKAMWMETEKEGGHIRLRIAHLQDYVPGEKVEAVSTPVVGDYAAAPAKSMDYSGKLIGKVSGYAEIEKRSGFLSSATVTITYYNYSDDGIHYYNGSESSSGSIMTKTIYTAELHVADASGQEVGVMDVKMVFSAAYKPNSFFTGSTTPELRKNQSHGTAVWYEKSAVISTLVK